MMARVMNAIGFVLVGLAFVYSLFNFYTREGAVAEQQGKKTIRFAHWRLEKSTLAAFDWAAREYERLHPDVRVVQMKIPLHSWQIWTNSQLIGETAPDLISYIPPFLTDEELARFFTPITPYLDDPNPYNEGTPLEGVPWIETFAENLDSGISYRANLLDYYTIPTTTNILRVMVNVDMYREVMGPERPLPATFRDFIAFDEAADELFRRYGAEAIFTVAGSRQRSFPLLDRLLGATTQAEREYLDWDYDRGIDFDQIDLLYALEMGEWEMDNERFRSALKALRKAIDLQTPSFSLQSQDDALFFFLQERAFSLPIFSLDGQSIRELVEFETAILPLPVPEPGDPEYGLGTLGPLSEGIDAYANAFALTQQSEHPEVAIDFLRFMSSYEANRTLAEISGLTPALPSIEPSEEAAAFAPNLEGFGAGYSFLKIGNMPVFSRVDPLLHFFEYEEVSDDELFGMVREAVMEGYLASLRNRQEGLSFFSRRSDSLLSSYSEISAAPDEEKMNLLALQQGSNEATYYQTRLLLKRREAEE